MAGLSNRLSSRVVKQIEKPKPLKSSVQPARYSSPDVPSLRGASSLDDIMAQVDAMSMHISSKNFAELAPLTTSMTSKLKAYGSKLEETHKEKLDKAFQYIRNGCRDDKLDLHSRVNLLQLVELRAMQWQPTTLTNNYYTSKVPVNEGTEIENSGHSAPVSQLLGPGELIKSSGKYSSPTKMPGKQYCKDEVVIRNADSGKVNPGAKERLVQITGPTESTIEFARQLMEETIRKNASPVREVEKGHLKDSTSSLTSSGSEDSASATHDTGMSDFPDGRMPYTHTVIYGDKFIEMNSNCLNTLTPAKIVLELYFGKLNLLPPNALAKIEDLINQMALENSRAVSSPPLSPVYHEPLNKDAQVSNVTHNVPVQSPAVSASIGKHETPASKVAHNVPMQSPAVSTPIGKHETLKVAHNVPMQSPAVSAPIGKHETPASKVAHNVPMQSPPVSTPIGKHETPASKVAHNVPMQSPAVLAPIGKHETPASKVAHNVPMQSPAVSAPIGKHETPALKVAHNVPMQSPAVSAPIGKHEKHMRIEYTRQFLMDCSTCPSASNPPSKELWEQIKYTFPELVKVNPYFSKNNSYDSPSYHIIC